MQTNKHAEEERKKDSYVLVHCMQVIANALNEILKKRLSIRRFDVTQRSCWVAIEWCVCVKRSNTKRVKSFQIQNHECVRLYACPCAEALAQCGYTKATELSYQLNLSGQ